jgi:glutamate/tyrosine decarboxylase-like PLP-dependent enzyme/mannose-6-phosphate isomerase-like protein (cupin superfamily)
VRTEIELDAKQRKILYQTELFEVASIEWTDKNVATLHNHGWSQCHVLIESGSFENSLDLGFKKEIQQLEKGQTFSTPLGSWHKLRCLSAQGRTLHVYAPKISERNEASIFKTSALEAIGGDLRLDTPTNFEELKKILENIRKHSISTDSPYFMNQLFSGVLPQMLLAEDVISQTKTTMATFEASPALSVIEAEVIESLGAIIGWPKDMRDGVCVPGGSAANFMAIHCARQKLLPEIKKNGMNEVKLKIFASEEAHYSLKKACATLGLGTDALIAVPADDHGRMKVETLESLVIASINKGEVPVLVCATAGTTVLGAFDPIDTIAQICKTHGLWLHVDGAWGGPALFSDQARNLVQGIELADSVTFDAHKLFGANLTCSFFLTKHAGLLLEANDVSGAEYLFHSDDATIDRGRLSWQCGRKADALSFWAIWKSLGTSGLGEVVDQLIAIRDETLDWIKTQPRLALVSIPDFLNVCIRILPPQEKSNSHDWSRKVREVLRENNFAFVNFSSDESGSFLRLILAHPYLQFKHVKQILKWSLEVE